MYKVTVKGELAGYSDTAVFVRLHKNGAYVPCDEPEAEGVCVKIPYEYEDDGGEMVQTVADTLYSLPGRSLKGAAGEAVLDKTSGPLTMATAEAVAEAFVGPAAATMSAKRAVAIRAVVEVAAAGLDDKTASAAPEIAPSLTGFGELVKSGTRINWKGTLKRAAVDLWDTAENTPDAAPALWEDILYKNGERIIPEVFTPGLMFSKDELGYWGDDLYRSKIDNNVWTPEAYPEGWELVE